MNLPVELVIDSHSEKNTLHPVVNFQEEKPVIEILEQSIHLEYTNSTKEI